MLSAKNAALTQLAPNPTIVIASAPAPNDSGVSEIREQPEPRESRERGRAQAGAHRDEQQCDHQKVDRRTPREHRTQREMQYDEQNLKTSAEPGNGFWRAEDLTAFSSRQARASALEVWPSNHGARGSNRPRRRAPLVPRSAFTPVFQIFSSPETAAPAPA